MILRKDYIPSTSHSRRRGFTLVEILVAATIFATLMAIIYGIFSSIEGGVAKVEANKERVRVMGFLLREISHNLTAAYMNMSTAAGPAAVEMAFVGEDIEEDGFAADSFHFASLAPPLGGAVAPGGPKLVSVMLERPPKEFLDEIGLGGRDKQQSFLNLREQQRLSMGLPGKDEEVGLDGKKRPKDETDKLFERPESGIKWSEDDGKATDLDSDQMTDSEPVWSIEVEAFNVEFFDGTAWVDSWDSSQMGTAQFGMLPWAVKIEIDFPPKDGKTSYADRLTDDKDQHDFETIVTIPASYGLWPDEAKAFE